MGIADGELTSIALCWRLERTDGAGIALTSHDRSTLAEGVVYEPTSGIVPAALTRSLGLEPHAGEVAGALSSESLHEADLVSGRWDSAQVRLSAVDWSAPSADRIDILCGEIGSISTEADGFSADLVGAAAKLQQPVCPATSAECRAVFGDKSCRVDLAGRSMRATVLSSGPSFLTLDKPVDSRFVLGRLRYLSGKNCGLTTVVLAASGTSVQVRDLPRAELEPPCVVELREGCDKRFETCVSRFANGENFRGEPHLPGNDLLTRYPGA